eukprot:scaffold134762_cov47-Prasinocladus_malaysianus.AAC.1
MKDRCLLYVEDLANRLYGDVSASSQWQAYQFAVRNGAHFKQIGRKPPCFEPRIESELRERLEKEKVKHEAQ